MRVENIVSLVLPPLYRLAMDNSEFVRTSFAASLNHMAAIVGKDATVEHLLPVMLTLLRDSASSVSLTSRQLGCTTDCYYATIDNWCPLYVFNACRVVKLNVRYVICLIL